MPARVPCASITDVLPSFSVKFLFIPWDFALILIFLATVIPWRGAARMKRLLAKPDLTSRDRLSLYVSTIALQWLLVALVALSCAARSVELDELGLAVPRVDRIVLVSVALTAVLCASQVLGLRGISRIPVEKRGTLYRITQKIMPRNRTESLVYSALACTAGISEEFLYRGFVMAAFVRIIVNYGQPEPAAAVVSSAWFALAHVYQGRRGLITTFVVGMIFAAVVLWTGSLLPAIVAHAGIDLTIGLGASRWLGESV